MIRRPDGRRRGIGGSPLLLNRAAGAVDSFRQAALVYRFQEVVHGLEAERLELKGVITFPLFDEKDDWYVFVFNAYEPAGTLAHPPEGELAWVPDAELPDLALWPGDRIFLPWLAEKRFFSAKFIYENGIFKDYSVEFY